MTLRDLVFPSLALCGLALAHPAQAGSYIALGDSYAYGFTTTQSLVASVQGFLATQDPADMASLLGLQGYVPSFAQSQGVAPQNILNLAIPGETLGSFFSFNSSSAINLNYLGAPAGTSQAALFTGKVSSLGSSVQDITVQLGGNDVIGLAASSAFQAAPTLAAKQALVTSALTAFNASYVPLLQTLKGDSPNVFAIGYFDPFTPLDTQPASGVQDPFGGLGALLLPQLNAAIQSDAAAAGVKYVDIATAFQGHEEQLSYDTQQLNQNQLGQIIPGYTSPLPSTFPDYHPNAQGYALIARQIANAAAVPEPCTWALLTLGLPLIGLVARRRKA